MAMKIMLFFNQMAKTQTQSPVFRISNKNVFLIKKTEPDDTKNTNHMVFPGRGSHCFITNDTYR
jgi:hypothetical protein